MQIHVCYSLPHARSQLVAQGVIDDTFALCFGFPSGGMMLLGVDTDGWVCGGEWVEMPMNLLAYLQPTSLPSSQLVSQEASCSCLTCAPCIHAVTSRSCRRRDVTGHAAHAVDADEARLAVALLHRHH
jgi:hypothetical protein